jgi:glycine/D-amino acid oxidase-like deaminating enzyme
LLTIPNQAKFHPLKYCNALVKRAKDNGVTVVNNTEVTKLSKGTPNILQTNRGEITADNVVIATYDPFNSPAKLFAHKGMYTSYVYEIEIDKGSIAEGLYMDQANPYHYFRIDKGEKKDRMILGGEDHRHEIPIDPEKNYHVLEKYLETLLPRDSYTIVKKWRGPILEPSDGLAYIGKLYEKENVYVAMGFSGNGMTYAHIAAQMFTDFIEKKKNMYEEIYEPGRIPTFKQILQKGIDYSEEFFGGAVKNTFVKES